MKVGVGPNSHGFKGLPIIKPRENFWIFKKAVGLSSTFIRFITQPQIKDQA